MTAIFSKRLGRHLHFGRKHHDPGKKRLFLQHYLGAMPSTPASCVRSTGINFPMMLNDQLGCCVEAMKGHAIQIFTRFIEGVMVTPLDQDILACYERNGGYQPGNPSTDQGESEQQSLQDYCTNGMAGKKATAFAAINPQDQKEQQVSTYYLGATLYGVSLPRNAIDLFDQHQPWTDISQPPDPSMGHAILGVDYTETGPAVVTWGAVQPCSWAWIEKYASEAYTVLWSNAQVINDVPNLNIQALLADYQALTGQTPPGPGPVTPPGPVNPPPGPIVPPPTPNSPVFDVVMAKLMQIFGRNPGLARILNYIQRAGDSFGIGSMTFDMAMTFLEHAANGNPVLEYWLQQVQMVGDRLINGGVFGGKSLSWPKEFSL